MTYEYTKKELFSYLKNNIPAELKDQIAIQYYEFVDSKMMVLIYKFITDNKIKKVPNILEWFVKIVEDH